MKRIQLLDCTLRDGAYVVDAKFGTPAVKGIIGKLEDANIEIIECGWLKDAPYEEGSTFFHVPSDVEQYLGVKSKRSEYVAMIDWNRYDLSQLEPCDGKSIDAIRVVFPMEHYKEGIALGKTIMDKGYKVYFQAANTLDYSDYDLINLAHEANVVKPKAISVVDTFGAMFEEDLSRIVSILHNNLDEDIMLGFHSHNNQQLSFSLSMKFIEQLYNTGRGIMVDASLCGMGRGAGNTTTELLVNYLNKKWNGNYDMNAIMDAIDTYMGYFIDHYSWGYSTPYFISGMYCAHVNNIAYLSNNHRTNAKDMRNIIGSLSEDERKKYDYDLLESKYLEYENKAIDDEEVKTHLKSEFSDRKILLLSPGKSIVKNKEQIKEYIRTEHPVVIGINSICEGYKYDYLFFSNHSRYDYAKEVYGEQFNCIEKIVTSNIKVSADEKESIINYNLMIKRGWKHFDNAVIMCLRLMNILKVPNVALAGFDGFSDNYAESYSDISLPPINPGMDWSELNREIADMFKDFKNSIGTSMDIEMVTESKYI